jgi:hypothetical protein
MTEHNHHRGTASKQSGQVYTITGKPWGYPDKSMQSWGARSELADKSFGAGIGNDFTNGHRGMAKSARGAKKFVRSRFRLHEKAATKKRMENACLAE